MYIAAADRSVGEHEWRPFVEAQAFGHLVAPGVGLDYPVVAPTQYALDGSEVLFHFARPNPVLDAVSANSHVVLSVAGDWAFIPSSWKAIGEEEPLLGIPTTYYGAVQLKGHAEVRSDPHGVADVLRRQLACLQPSIAIADPSVAHPGQLTAIRGVVLTIDKVAAKFKYGGNVDTAHRLAIAKRLHDAAGPVSPAATHTERRLNSA